MTKDGIDNNILVSKLTIISLSYLVMTFSLKCLSGKWAVILFVCLKYWFWL